MFGKRLNENNSLYAVYSCIHCT